MVSYATSMADFVVIPVQGSQLDAKQAARQMKLIKAQERIANRPIPFAVLFTRTIRAMFSYGGTIAGRSNKRVSNLPTTLQNAREFTAEIVDRLRARPSGRCQRPCHLACAFDETLRGGINGAVFQRDNADAAVGDTQVNRNSFQGRARTAQP